MTTHSRILATAAALIGLAVLAAAPPAAAQTAVPSWVRTAPKQAFDPVQPGVRRPGILLETDYYAYGPGTGFDTPEVTVTLRTLGYDDPATLYLYWQDRDSGQTLYYNVAEGFTNQERDLFGTGEAPAKVFVPELADFRLFGAGSAFGPLPSSVPSDTGLYQFVLEIRNATGDTVIARSNAMYNQVDGVVPVVGNINGTADWTSNNAYFLRGAPTFVTDGSRLNIEPGTVIFGSRSDQGTLAVAPGGKIFAEGDAMRPIIFTSELPVGERGPGDWGGLVISGRAPVNGGSRIGEGDSGQYGGDNPADSSGRLRYVRVEFAGIRFNETNELNGIALQGVGTGTVIDHIQVHHNSDDGIEFFGGTAQVKYVLITDARDDSFDWTFGWQGKAQHVVAIQRNNDNDHGIEADNDENNFDLEPRSNPTIYNATFVGNQLRGGTNEDSILLRRGTYVTLRNFIVMGWAQAGIKIDGQPTLDALGNQAQITHGIVFNNGSFATPSEASGFLQGVLSQADPRLPAPADPAQPDVAPLGGSPARSGAAKPPSDGFFDTNVSWLGGVNPNDPWIDDGWTTFSDN